MLGQGSIKNLNFSFLRQVFQYCLLGLNACRLRFASHIFLYLVVILFWLCFCFLLLCISKLLFVVSDFSSTRISKKTENYCLNCCLGLVISSSCIGWPTKWPPKFQIVSSYGCFLVYIHIFLYLVVILFWLCFCFLLLCIIAVLFAKTLYVLYLPCFICSFLIFC